MSAMMRRLGMLALFLFLLAIVSPVDAQKRSTARPSSARTVVAAPQVEAPPPPPPDPPPPDFIFDKDTSKELSRGILLADLQQKGKLPKKPYTPPEKMLQPFAAGALGSTLAFEVARGKNIVVAPLAQAHAQAIVDRLLQGVPVPARPVIPVYITAEPYYGAIATRSGAILVSIGTFNAESSSGAASDEELALMLGHEIGHIVMNHVAGNKLMEAAVGFATMASSGFLLYSRVKGSTWQNGKLQGQGDKALMMKSLIGGLASSTLIEDLLWPGMDRAREMEADRFGIDLAKLAKYALTRGDIQKFINSHAEAQVRRSERITKLRLVLNAIIAQAAPAVAKSVGDRKGTTQTLVGIFGGVLTEAMTEAIIKATASHPKTDERRAFAWDYYGRFYEKSDLAPDGSRLKRSRAQLTMVTGQPELRDLIVQVRDASTIREQLIEASNAPGDDGRFTEVFKQAGLKVAGADKPLAAEIAPGKARKSTKKHRDAPQPENAHSRVPARAFANDAAAITLEMQGIVHVGNGDLSSAQASWRRGLRSDYASVDMGRKLSDTLPNDPASAVEFDAMLARYQRLMGTTDPVLDVVVGSAMSRGDVAGAEVAAARCLTYDDGKLYPYCVARLGYNPAEDGQSATTAAGAKAFGKAKLKKTTNALGKVGDVFR